MSRKALGRGLSALFTQTTQLEIDLIELEIDQLEPAEAQPRKYFNEEKLNELAVSIKSNGIIQPIVARRFGDRFQIIAGERRWRAAKIAGLQKIPCIIKDIPEANILEVSLIENIQRQELNPIEEAMAYKNLLERLDVTQEEIAQRVGKDRSSITNALRLLRLPMEIQRLVEEDKLSMGHARALLSIESEDVQKSLALEINDKNLSVRETERLIKVRQVTGRVKKKDLDSSSIREETANLTAAEFKLSKRLGAPVKIKFQKAGGLIEIKYSSSEDLARIFDILIQTTRPDGL
jgi:ParB family chromosome partitioning protein